MQAVEGSAVLVADIVRSGQSLLLLGCPGVGKTTVIRDIARALGQDYKRVSTIIPKTLNPKL